MPTSIDYTLFEYLESIEDLPAGDRRTTVKLFEMGMCCCDSCGHLTSIDYRYCKHCNELVLILKE